MNLQAFEFNLFGEKTYVAWDNDTHEGAVIDPGMSSESEQRVFADFISRNGIKLKYLLYTHLHVDHTFGHEFIHDTYGLEATAHPADAPLGEARDAQARMFRLRIPALKPLHIATQLTDNETLPLGNETIQVICVPGHSPGSVAYYCPESSFVLTGDALFHSGIGRTDLPGGNHRQLVDSIRNRLFTLPPDTEVYPGHGSPTTIGDEERTNPYV